MPRWICRGVVLTVALVGPLWSAGTATASYPGANGLIAWQDDESGPASQESTAVRTMAATIATCNNSSGALGCVFGRPGYSPDGLTVVVSRLVPIGASVDAGSQGTLMLVGSDGSAPRTLTRQTADDEQPAFLASGDEIVFAGRASAAGQQNLYSVRTDGTGLSQLTFAGGSWPAPCPNGTIAYERQGAIYLLSRGRQTERRIVRGGSEPDCSPDGGSIAFMAAAGGGLSTIRTDGTHLRQLPSLPGGDSPAYSPDGQLIAYRSWYDDPSADGSAIELDVVDLAGNMLGRLPIGGESGGSIGSDGTQTLAGGPSWQPVSLTPPPKGALTRVPGSPFGTGRRAFPLALAFSPSGRLLVTGNEMQLPGRSYLEGSLSEFSVSRSGVLHGIGRDPLRIHSGVVDSVAFSPDGRLLAAAAGRGGVSMFSVRSSGQLVQVPGSPFRTPTKALAGQLAFSPSGKLLAVSGGLGTVLVFRVSNAGFLRAIARSPFKTGSASNTSALGFDPSGRLLATETYAGRLSVLSVNRVTGALSIAPGSPVPGTLYSGSGASVAFDPSGKWLVVSGGAVTEFAVDPATGTLSKVPGSPFGPGLSYAAVAFSPRGGLLAGANDDSFGGLHGVTMFTQSSTGALTAVTAPPWVGAPIFAGYTATVTCPCYGSAASAVAFSPSGRLVALANMDGRVTTFAVR